MILGVNSTGTEAWYRMFFYIVGPRSSANFGATVYCDVLCCMVSVLLKGNDIG